MKPIVTSVCVRVAASAEDANAQCKKLLAYREILEKYPSMSWGRRHLRTSRHPQSGLWMIEFEVTPKGAP